MRIRLIRAMCLSGVVVLFTWMHAPECLALPSQMPPQMSSQMPMPEEISGHVLNATTGKPQPAIDLHIVKPGQGGMEIARTVKSDAQGKFKLAKASELLLAPHLLQAEYQGVTYTVMLRPMANLSDLELRIYETTASAEGMHFSIPNMLIRREGDTLKIDEIYQIENGTNRSFFSSEGTFRFYLPSTMTNLKGVSVTAAGSTMPVSEEPSKLPDGKGYKIAAALKPGRTQVHLEYEVSYAGGRASVLRKFVYPLELFSLAVSPEDIDVQSNLLRPPSNEESTGFKMRSASSIPAEKEVTIELTGGSSRPPEPAAGSGNAEDSGQAEKQQIVLLPPEISRYKVLIIFNLAVLMAAFLGWRLTSHDPAAEGAGANASKKGVSRGKLLKQREELLDQLADLDERLETQALSPREHQQKRQALKSQLIELTGFLEKDSVESKK